MEIEHIAITTGLLLNAGILTWIAINSRNVSKQVVKANDESEPKSGPTVEIRYFDYIEDHQGAVKNSKRFIVKAQVFVAGLPVGEQFVMSEQIVEEFSYEKIRQLKSEIITPLVGVASDTFLAMKGIPPAGGKAITDAISAFKLKSG